MTQDSHLLPVYARSPLSFARGEGSRLITNEGASYLDFAAGIAVNILGHCHPALVAALQNQAEKLWHTSNLYRMEGQEHVADLLCANSFADHVFFTNSGVEAIECAIKMARHYQFTQGHAERFRVITFEGAFHGRTLAAIAAGGQKKYLEGFGPKVDGFDQVPFGDVAALKAAVTPATAAVLLEPIQGEGGMRSFDLAHLKDIRKVCDDNGLLLIFDEVQCGLGRTGRLFAYEWSGTAPDIMALAKGLGGGFPVGACLATHKASEGMTAGVHGTTFGGNPLAMAVAEAVLRIVTTETFLNEVRGTALHFRQKLESLPALYPDVVEAVRGTGLMLGIRLKLNPPDMVAALRALKLLTVGAGDNVLRLLPPLNVTTSEIDEAFDKLEQGCAQLQKDIKGAA